MTTSDDEQEPFGTRAGIFRPLGRHHLQNMTRKHSRECKKNWQAEGDEKYSTVIKGEEEDDYVMVDKPREPLSGA